MKKQKNLREYKDAQTSPQLDQNPQEEQSGLKALSESEVLYFISLYKDKIAKYRSEESVE
jgi:hypothetical protein